MRLYQSLPRLRLRMVTLVLRPDSTLPAARRTRTIRVSLRFISFLQIVVVRLSGCDELTDPSFPRFMQTLNTFPANSSARAPVRQAPLVLFYTPPMPESSTLLANILPR